jgi:hypothetical protein
MALYGQYYERVDFRVFKKEPVWSADSYPKVVSLLILIRQGIEIETLFPNSQNSQVARAKRKFVLYCCLVPTIHSFSILQTFEEKMFSLPTVILFGQIGESVKCGKY